MMHSDSKYIINSLPPDYKCSSTCFDFDKQVIDYVHKRKNNNNSITGKCILVGDAGVGKTCMVNRFGKNIFTENYKLTIGVDFEVKDFSILGHSFKLNLWDTAGEERFKSITKTYYRNAHVAIIVFDFSSIATLSSIQRWANEVLNCAISKNPFTGQMDEPILFLVGTKKDLVCESAFEFIEEEAIKIAKEIKAQYWAVSSQTGENVNQLFRNVAALSFTEIVLRELEANDYAATLKIEDKKVYANNFISQTSSLSPIKLKKNSKERFKGFNKKLGLLKFKCFRF